MSELNSLGGLVLSLLLVGGLEAIATAAEPAESTVQRK
jgi:hypothetical protein